MLGKAFFASPACTKSQLDSLNFIRSSKSIKLFASLNNFPLASRIIVKNLSYSVSEACLKKEFSKFGEVIEVKLVKDEDRKRSKGYAFIQFTSQDEAMLALENMDHKTIDGRIVYVDLAKFSRSAFGEEYPRTSGPPLNWKPEKK